MVARGGDKPCAYYERLVEHSSVCRGPNPMQFFTILAWHNCCCFFFFLSFPAIKGMHINTQVDGLKSESILSNELLQSWIEPSEIGFLFFPQIHLRIVYEFISTAKTENI